MIKKTLATLILFTSIAAPIKSNASFLTLFPYITITAPTQLLFNKDLRKDISESRSNSNSDSSCNLSILIFALFACGVRDVAEIKMDAENVIFGFPISNAEEKRLRKFIREIKEKIPAAHDLSDDAVILELANSQIFSK